MTIKKESVQKAAAAARRAHAKAAKLEALTKSQEALDTKAVADTAREVAQEAAIAKEAAEALEREQVAAEAHERDQQAFKNRTVWERLRHWWAS